MVLYDKQAGGEMMGGCDIVIIALSFLSLLCALCTTVFARIISKEIHKADVKATKISQKPVVRIVYSSKNKNRIQRPVLQSWKEDTV